MKIGMLAQCSDRGLGTMTREFYRHVQPDRCLVVLPENDLPKHTNWYDPINTTYISWAGGHFDGEEIVKHWLAGLDVLYSAETLYDWRLAEWASDAGVKTVVHAMAEYFHKQNVDKVDQWWAPTSWRMNTLPPTTRLVPVPIATDRFVMHPDPYTKFPVRWLHPGGARAAMDRNGTTTFMRALQHLRGEHEVTINTQQPIQYPNVADGVRLTMHETGAQDYWAVYDNIDAVVIPRKYGGLCLPALEALGAGCALLMPDVSPQIDEWPIVPIPSHTDGYLHIYNRSIPLAQVQPADLAEQMDLLAMANAETLTKARLQAIGFARRNSWNELLPLYLDEFERVLE